MSNNFNQSQAKSSIYLNQIDDINITNGSSEGLNNYNNHNHKIQQDDNHDSNEIDMKFQDQSEEVN